jgi:ubiquinone/menaquinone biosynthesis C-methylase UbiE
VAVYDLLAPYYDAATGDAATEAAFIESTIKDAHPNPVALLEVACGTGGIINSLASRYQVAGLDISPGMLAVARDKLPEGTPLQVADMSRFELGARFDAVFCVYYGVNHLLSFSAWKDFFDCAYRHLNEGGVLAFDTFTMADLEVIAGIPETVQQFGENDLRIRIRVCGEAMFDWEIAVAVQRDGRRELLTEVIRTAAFPADQIRDALSERFTDIKIIETDGGISENGSRVWFVCTRPRAGV